MKKRYALVGTGGRSVLYVDALVDRYRAEADLVALCDLSQVRMDWHNRRMAERFGTPPVPTFRADQFGDLLATARPEVVIVCTVDSTHHEYIIRALEAGCDVISEKPLTTDATKARAILAAVERTRRRLQVTFNFRFAPSVSRVCELLRQGVIGRPLAVDFSWVLDTGHGADYFRRWHREKDKSGGLLVHKSTHHFDLVNWWIQSIPAEVFAMGDLKFYGRRNAEARGVAVPYARYTGQPAAKTDPFALFLDADHGAEVYSANTLKGLYQDAEAETGYIRDQNVFSDGITIEDTLAVMVRYRNGVILNYSLLAYSPWEGLRVAITGDKGRVELYERHGGHIIAGQSDAELGAAQAVGLEHRITVFPMFGLPYETPIPHADGGHGGSDPLLVEQLFSPHPPTDPLHRLASHLDGAASLLVGLSANESIRTGQPVQCRELIDLPRG